jgi:hypothetical protein
LIGDQGHPSFDPVKATKTSWRTTRMHGAFVTMMTLITTVEPNSAMDIIEQHRRLNGAWMDSDSDRPLVGNARHENEVKVKSVVGSCRSDHRTAQAKENWTEM